MTFNKRPRWVYTFSKISPRSWVEMVRAESKGRYFQDNIRSKKPYTRITVNRASRS